MESLANDTPVVIDDLTPGGYVSLIHTGPILVEERINEDPATYVTIYTAATSGKMDIPCLATGVLRVTRGPGATGTVNYLITPAA
jgi:hypothetical protein